MRKMIKYKEPLYLKYWDVINLYGWAMSHKLPVNKFKWIEGTSPFNEDFRKGLNEEGNEGYFLEVDVKDPEKLHELFNDLAFLPERMKFEKVKELVANLHDKTGYVIRIRSLMQALNHGLILEKVCGVIKFNRKAWVKPDVGMNTKTKSKKWFSEGIFQVDE